MFKNRRTLFVAILAACAAGLTGTLILCRPGIAADPAERKQEVTWEYAFMTPDYSETEITEIQIRQIKGEITMRDADVQIGLVCLKRRFETPSETIRAGSCVELNDKLGGKKGGSMSDLLTAIGSKGWELVAVVDGDEFIFKRRAN